MGGGRISPCRRPLTEANAAVTDANLLPLIDYLTSAGYFQLYYDQFLPPAVGGVVNDESQALVAGSANPGGHS